MRKKILWIGASLLLLIILLLLFLHTSFVKAKVLNYIRKQLAQSYNLSLTADSLDYNLLTLDVSLKKITLKSLEKPDQPPFFQADQLKVHLTTALIFKQQIDLASLYIEKSLIDIHVYFDNTFNVPSQLFKKTEAPIKPVIIRQIIIKNGSIFYHDPSKNMQANIQGFYLSGALPETDKKEFILQLPNQAVSSLVFKDHTLRLNQAKITTHLHDRTVLISLAGTYINVNEPFTISGKVHWEENLVSVPEFHFIFSEGEISGSGDYYSPRPSIPTAPITSTTPTTPTPPGAILPSSRVSLAWKNLNLQSRLLTRFFSHPVYSQTSGSLDMTFKELAFKSIKGNITAVFQPLKIPSAPPGFIPITGKISLHLAAGKITIPAFDLFAQADDVQGKLIIKNGAFQAEINGTMYNKPFISGHLQFSGQINPDLANPTVTAHVASNGLNIDNIIELLAEGTLRYENGRLTTDDLVVQTKDAMPAKVTISGTIPITTSPTGSTNPLNITVKAQDIPIERLAGIINKNYKAEGTLSLNAHLLNQNYQANVQISNLKIDRSSLMPGTSTETTILPPPQWLDIGNISGQFELVQNRLNYSIQAPDLFININGSGRTSPPYPLNGQLIINIPSLENLTSPHARVPLGFPFLENIAGHIQARVNFKLNLTTGLNDLNADAVITKLSLHSQGQDIENIEPIHISYTPAGITVHNLELRSLGSEISGKGFLPQNVSLEKNLPGITFLARIDPTLLNLFIPSLQFGGQLSLNARLSGSLTQPFLTTELTLKQFSFARSPLQPITTTTPAPKGFRGLIEGYIRTSGNIRNIQGISAEAQFPIFEFQLGGVAVLRASEPVRLRFENSRLRLQPMTLRDERNLSNFNVSGAVAVADSKSAEQLDITIAGQVDAQFAGLFLENFHFNGQNDLSLHIGGRLQNPEISGNMTMNNVEASIPNEKIYIDQVNGKILFMNNRIVIGPLTGKLNDGDLNLEGEIILSTNANGFWQKIDINFTSTKSHFEFPKGLFSEISSRLNFSFNNGNYLLKGTVEINDGVYKESFNFLNQVLDYLRSPPIQEVTEESAFTELINMDIEVHTISPIYIDTNLSRSEISADVTVGGTLARPSLGGRVLMKEGGEIYLGKHKFSVENGTINFVNPYRIDPELNIRARGKVNNYDIVMSITGPLSDLSVSLTSTPPLPQPNIIGLLMGQFWGGTAGKENTSQSFLAFAGSRAMGYLGNALSGSLGKLVKGTLGFENFRLDGSLIASKDNPGARITIGQHLTPKLELILSQSLTQAQNRTWIINYKPLRNFSVEVLKQDRENYTTSVLAELLFGRKPKTEEIGGSTSKPLKIKDIVIQGDTGLPISLVRKKIKLRQGKKFNFFKFHDDLERLRKLYLKNDYLRADINGDRFEEDGKITVRYTINAGPRIYLDFHGANLPRSFLKKACGLWCDGRFDLQSTKYVVREVYLRLYKKGYYQAQVTAGTPSEGTNAIRYPINIEKGPKYERLNFIFNGNKRVKDKTLNRILKKMKLRRQTFYDPSQVINELTRYYKERGFLEIHIKLPDIRYFPEIKKAEVEFLIFEGPQARINQITFTGNHFLESHALLKVMSLKKDDVFSTVKINEVSYRITEAYAKKGFNNIRVTYAKEYVRGAGLMNLEFKIEENQRGIIREITITGNSLTRPFVIKRELTFKEGDILDFHEINKSRMKLYELEIFQWIDIDTQPIENEQKPGVEKPFRVVIKVSEMRPFRIKGGLQWDSQNKLGGVLEFSSPNTFGKAHFLGLSIIADQKDHGFKGYYRLPYFFKYKLPTEFFIFTGKQEEPSYTISRNGFTIQQQYKYWRILLFSFSYTWERDHVTKPVVGPSALISIPPVLDTKFNLGYVTGALTYDRRNNILDPTHGFFLSGSLLVARKFLGSQVNFYRFYGEGHLYISISRLLVIASSLRAGSGRGLGQEFLPGERFFAGGGNTLRGFKESMVGPLDENGNSLGGEALFIFNQELRIRLNRMFIFVIFADIGNVYATAKEFDIFNVRKSAGFGLRVYTGPLLLRADLGFILDRRKGEPASRLILSIGQTF